MFFILFCLILPYNNIRNNYLFYSSPKYSEIDNTLMIKVLKQTTEFKKKVKLQSRNDIIFQNIIILL